MPRESRLLDEGNRVVVHSPESPAECLRRLKARSGREAWLLPQRGLIGPIEPERVSVYLGPRGRDSFKAYFDGTIRPDLGGGSRLEGRLQFHRRSLVVIAGVGVMLVAWLLASLQYFVARIVRGEGPDLPVLVLVGLPALLATGFLLMARAGLRAYRRDRMELLAFIEESLGGAQARAAGED